jgi:hypothetical protein
MNMATSGPLVLRRTQNMTSSDDGLLVLSGWKTKGTLLGVCRAGDIGASDTAYVQSIGEGVVTLRFQLFSKSFTFSQVDPIETVPHLDKNSFTRAVRLSGGSEFVILLEYP